MQQEEGTMGCFCEEKQLKKHMHICSKGSQQTWHLVSCFIEEKEFIQRE